MKKKCQEIRKELYSLANCKQAKSVARYFKEREKLQFLGVKVPEIRALAKKHSDLSLDEISSFIKASFHEERLLGFVILQNIFKKADEKKKKEIFDFYVAHLAFVDNWDLVDDSAPGIVGAYLLDKPKTALYSWAKSASLWERRIAIVATHIFIKKGYYEDTLAIAELLLNDKEDLIHKAAGWMLREVGKKDLEKLKNFLERFHVKMPRTMLRYSIEKFPETLRQKYLKLRTK